MATGPIHPEIRAEANWRLRQEVLCLKTIGLCSRDAKRIVRSVNRDHVRLLQERVERAYDDCVVFLYEGLTEERKGRVREVLQQLAPYPTICAQLERWIRSLAPDMNRELGNAAAG